MNQRKNVLPGFPLSLGITVLYLGLIVLIPLSALLIKTTSMSFSSFIQTVTDPRVLSAYRISFGLSFIAAIIDLFAGAVIAWVLVRYRFPLRGIFDALIDLPFALQSFPIQV